MSMLRALFLVILFRSQIPPEADKYVVKAGRWLLAAMFIGLIADTIVHHFQ